MIICDKIVSYLNDFLQPYNNQIRSLNMDYYMRTPPTEFKIVNGNFFRYTVMHHHCHRHPHLTPGKYPRLVEAKWKVVIANATPQTNLDFRRDKWSKWYISLDSQKKYYVSLRKNTLETMERIKQSDIVDPFIPNFQMSNTYDLWRRIIYKNLIRYDHELMQMFCKYQPMLGIYELLPNYTKNSSLIYCLNDLLNASNWKNYPKLRQHVLNNPDIYNHERPSNI